MPEYFFTIEEAKKFARDRVLKDEEAWHIAWHDTGNRVLNKVQSAWVKQHIAAISDPERNYSSEAKEQGLTKTIFATVNTERDKEGQLTLSLDEKQWNLIADMLDMKNKELGQLSNEEIYILEELKKRGM